MAAYVRTHDAHAEFPAGGPVSGWWAHLGERTRREVDAEVLRDRRLSAVRSVWEALRPLGAGLHEAERVVHARYEALGDRVQRTPPDPLDLSSLTARAAALPGRVAAVEALWDGDTVHDWFVLLVGVLDAPEGEGHLQVPFPLRVSARPGWRRPALEDDPTVGDKARHVTVQRPAPLASATSLPEAAAAGEETLRHRRRPRRRLLTRPAVRRVPAAVARRRRPRSPAGPPATMRPVPGGRRRRRRRGGSSSPGSRRWRRRPGP